MRKSRIRPITNAHLGKMSAAVLYFANLIGPAMLILGILSGGTEIARNVTAQMETAVSGHLLLAQAAIPLAWFCLISSLVVAVTAASLVGSVALRLQRNVKSK